MRPNFDTMYSFAVIDVSEDDQTVTLVMPTNEDGEDRYQSALVISEEHWLPLIAEEPGTYKLTKESVGTPFCFLIIRTQVNMNDPNDILKVQKMQQRLKLSVSNESCNKPYIPSNLWDKEEVLSMRAYYEKYFVSHDEITSENMFGPKNCWPLLNHNCGSAVGWGKLFIAVDNHTCLYHSTMLVYAHTGGFPKEQAAYPQISVSDNSGTGRFKITLKDVPIKVFWSVTVYDNKGYVSTKDGDVYNINSAFAVANDDSSYTIHFGNDYDKNVTTNVMNIMKGWNITLRLYQPSSAYFDGKWKLPELVKDE